MLPLFLFVSSLTFLILTEAAAIPPPNLCVRNATFNPAIGQCTCDVGYKGNPRLCCGPKDKGVCHLISDPILNTAHDLTAEISYPCTTSIAVVKKVFNGQECSIRFTIAGPYRDDGALFYDRSGIYIKYGASERYVPLIHDERFVKSEESNYTTMLTNVETVIKVGDHGFSISFDNFNDRWLVNGCGGQLVYRPPGDNTQESRPPGVCVIAPTDSIAKSLSDGEICNLEPGFNPAPYENKEQAILANMILGYSKISAGHIFDPLGYSNSCKNVSLDFSICGSDFDKANAIRRCGNILLGFKNRHCFNRAHNRVFAVFTKCIRASCHRDMQACTEIHNVPDIQSCLPEVQRCYDWY